MSTDPIADMLTIIRNAIAAGKSEVSFPYSKVKEEIVKILVHRGYLSSYEVVEGSPASKLQAVLARDNDGYRLSVIDRISKPGRRHYAKKDEIPRVLSGRGMVVLSTSHGMMSGDEARQKGLGGEVICKVW